MSALNRTLIALTSLLAVPAAAGPISAGAVVRIQAAITAGDWYQGRMVLDDQKCWMVKLDRPTPGQYTMLALIVVDRIEVSNSGRWSALELKPVLAAQPEVCNEYAND